MDIEANDLLLFARIVDAGSFSRAAERVGLPKSTVSRRMTHLEARLGERLLQRTTRKLALTEFGANLLDHARQVAAEVEAAAAFVEHRQAEPSGRLRVSMPADFASFSLGDMLPAFIARYPQIVLELDLSPRRVDVLAEGFDLAVRMGELPDDASLTARRLTALDIGLYAAPQYTARRGLPDDPAGLLQHDALCLLSRSGGAMPWTLMRGKVRWEGLPPARGIANSPELLLHLAGAGCGIVTVADQFAAPYVQSGALVRVLPEWSLPPVTAWAVFPGRRLMPAKTKVFLAMIDQALAGGMPNASRHRPG